MDFLEENYMKEQIESINQISRLITIYESMDIGMSEYFLDRQLLKGEITNEHI